MQDSNVVALGAKIGGDTAENELQKDLEKNTQDSLLVMQETVTDNGWSRDVGIQNHIEQLFLFVPVECTT